MKWFRRHIKAGSRLALFALALQFVLSFGHLHVDAAQAVPSIQALVDVAHTGDTGASIPSDREPPASRDNHQSSDEPCAICAVVSMASCGLYSALTGTNTRRSLGCPESFTTNPSTCAGTNSVAI